MSKIIFKRCVAISSLEQSNLSAQEEAQICALPHHYMRVIMSSITHIVSWVESVQVDWLNIVNLRLSSHSFKSTLENIKSPDQNSIEKSEKLK